MYELVRVIVVAESRVPLYKSKIWLKKLVELLRQCEVGYTAVAVHAVIIVKVLPLGFSL